MEQYAMHELDELMLAAVAGRLADDQRARIETLVLADDAAARRYLDHIHLMGELRWRNGASHDPFTAAEPVQPAEPADRWWHMAYDWIAHPTPLSLLVAALFCTSFLLSLALITVPAWRPGVANKEIAAAIVVAELVDTRLATWSAKSDINFKNRSVLNGDTVILDSGFAELAFRDGATVLLEGPCQFIATSGGAGRLARGKLVAQVPPQAVGFTIDTPQAQIVDLGTEFGVLADQAEGTSVNVFAGAVRVCLMDEEQTSESTQVIRAGESVRISGGAGSRQIERQSTSDGKFVRKLTDVPDPRADALRAYRQEVLKDKPVALWLLKEKRGLVAEDAVGARSGSYQGNVLHIRDGWDAARFDGQTARVEVPFDKALNPQGDFTVEAWVRVRQHAAGQYGSVVTSRVDAAGDARAGYMLYAGATNKWEFWLDGDQPMWSVLKGSEIAAGEWTHLVGVYDGKNETMALFVNGEQAAQSDAQGFRANSKSVLSIGAGGDAGTQYYFNGDIAAVAVYNHALNSEAISQRFNLGRAMEPSIRSSIAPSR